MGLICSYVSEEQVSLLHDLFHNNESRRESDPITAVWEEAGSSFILASAVQLLPNLGHVAFPLLASVAPYPT